MIVSCSMQYTAVGRSSSTKSVAAVHNSPYVVAVEAMVGVTSLVAAHKELGRRTHSHKILLRTGKKQKKTG